MPSVIVIGGGVSGLACARFILDRMPDADLKLLEASDSYGGNICTEQSQGFVTELGPNGFLNQHRSTLELAESVGLSDDVITGCERMRRRYIFWRGRLRRFPDSPATFLGTDLLSLSARARVLMEPLVPANRSSADETVGQFARRRLGREAADLLIDPVVSGIYAGDFDRLSLRSALPQLAQLDGMGRSVLVAMVQNRNGGTTDRSASPSVVGRRRYVSFRKGLQQLTDGLVDNLGSRIRANSPVAKVEPHEGGWRVWVNGPEPEALYADVVVSAAPAPSCRRYLRDLHPGISEACISTPYAPVAMVALGYREVDMPHPLEGFGYLVPSRVPGSVLGVLWPTSIFPGHRAAPGKVLIQAVLGGARQPDVCGNDDDVLVHRARVHLKKALGVTVDPVYSKVKRHRVGIPQYEVGHGERLQQLECALSDFRGLFVTGNAFRGVGINACTTDAEGIAERACAYLEAIPSRGESAARVKKATVSGISSSLRV